VWSNYLWTLALWRKWTITVIVCYAKGKGRTIQPKLDRTDPVKSAASESAIPYGSHTDSDLPWTVRKYMSISKRKHKTLHTWCGARNSAVSGWHWLLLAVNQSRTSVARCGRCGRQSEWCGFKTLSNTLVNDFRHAEQCERRQSKCCGWAHVGKWEYLPVHCRRLWDCASAPIDRTFARPYI